MASDAFIGILSGLGEAHRAHQKNIFDQEVSRREKMAATFEKLAEHPNITPEGQDEYYRKAFALRTLEPHKKVPADVEKFVTEVAPKFGQSWMGGQTEQKIETQPMPIPSALPQPQSAPGSVGILNPATGQLETGARGAFGPEEPLPKHQPPASTIQASMPSPPPGVMRSTHFSPQEIAQREIAKAVQTLEALGPIHQQQRLEMLRAEQAMEPPSVGSFPAESGLFEMDPRTRKTRVIREPRLKPEKPPNLTNFSPEEVKLDGKGPVTVLRDLDPASPTAGRVFLPTLKGMQDVTGRTDTYQKPTQPPYIVRVEGAVSDAAKELPQDWRNVVRRAMPNTLPAATRLGRMNEAAEYLAANDVEGLKSRVRQWAIESENVGTQMQVEGRADALVAMKDGLALLNNMRREGVDTNILTGTWEEIVRKLGTTSHPKRVEFASRMQRALSAYTLAMSGVQFSENEAKRYYELFPNASNTLLVNEALAKSLLRSMGAEDKRFWEQKLDIPGAKLVSAIPTEQQQQREIVTYQGRRYYLVGKDANGNAILEPIP